MTATLAWFPIYQRYLSKDQAGGKIICAAHKISVAVTYALWI